MELDKIYNANAYEFVKTLPENSVDCVYIDIPYLHTRGGGSKLPIGQRYAKRELELIGYDEKLIKNTDPSKYNALRVDKYKAEQRLELVSIEDGIDYSIFDDLCRVMKKINIFIWCSKLQMLDIMNYFVGQKKCLFELLVWGKENAMPTNNSFICDMEQCFYFREPGIKLNGGYLERARWYISPTNKVDKKRFKHPTIKPLSMVQNHLKVSTKEEDVVLDCFLGSGTTAVACKNLNRPYIGVELNPKFYKQAVDRVNQVDSNGQMSLFAI